MKKSTVYSLQSTVKTNLVQFALAVVGRLWTVDQQGFTIVEVLVVATILGIIGYMMSDIVSRSLAGNQKTILISTAKQNGQIALDTISQAVRSSDQVVCVDGLIPNPVGPSSGSTIALYSQDGTYVRFQYISGVTSFIAEDQPVVNILLSNSDAAHSQTLVCDTTQIPVNNRTILTDTDSTNGVLIKPAGGATPQPIFTVVKRPGSKDSVTIQFDVRPSIAGTGYQNQLGGSGAIQFQQTIQLR